MSARILPCPQPLLPAAVYHAAPSDDVSTRFGPARRDEFHAKNWGRKSKAAKRKAAEDAEAKSKRAKEQESAGPENVPADGERPTPVAALQDVAAATKQAKQMMDEDLIDQEVVDIMTHPAFTTPGANGEMYGASDLSE